MASAPMPVTSFRLKNILFTTDFSPGSEPALVHAQALATRFGSTIHLLHVLEPAPYLGLPIDFAAPLDSQLESAERQAENFLAAYPQPDIPHKVLIRRGPLWHVVADAIRHFDIDMVVTGTHGRRGLKKLMLGSAAEEIFRRAGCPVLTIGPHIVEDAHWAANSILYATDFSPASIHALSYAIGFARENRARMILLHVVGPTAEMAALEVEEMTQAVRRQLRDLIPGVPDLPFTVETCALAGSPAEHILRIAEDEQVRLIVMGARRSAWAGVTSYLPWATAHRVVCEAYCPVLTVRG
jgi:nucleotide-binding universal stress UspA family protein